MTTAADLAREAETRAAEPPRLVTPDHVAELYGMIAALAQLVQKQTAPQPPPATRTRKRRAKPHKIRENRYP